MPKINPLTLEVSAKYYKVGKKILEEIGEKYDSLREFNDQLSRTIATMDDLPADTRFPGFFSSIADHALLTSAIAVAMALDLYRKGSDFSSEYQGEMSKLLSTEEGLKEVVRTASLLHDIGKHPPVEHSKRGYEYSKKILTKLGFGSIAEDVSLCVLRHHYRKELAEELKPKTKLEWVVALADKVAVVDRGIVGTQFVQIYDWMLQKLEQNLNEEDKRNIKDLVEFLRGERDTLNDIRILPLKMDEIFKADRVVFNPKEVFGFEPEVGILCMEIAGIQRFVMASDNRKYISGASALLENVLREVSGKLARIFAPESIVYAKGGSMLAIIPASYYKDIAKEISEIFRKRTLVVRPKLPQKHFFKYKLGELKYGPEFLWSDERDAFNRKFGSAVARVLHFLEVEENGSEELDIPVAKICKYCYEYPGESEIIDGDEKVLICKRCEIAVKEHKRKRESLLFKVDVETGTVGEKELIETEIWKKVGRRFEDKLKSSKVLAELKSKEVKEILIRSVDTWDHLGRQPFYTLYGDRLEGDVYDVAFIKGDGDNFGKIKETAQSPAAYREISRIFENVIEGSIVEAFSDILIKEMEIFAELLDNRSGEFYELEAPFDIIFIGGDDFFVVLDPAYVFTFIRAFRRNVQKLLGERGDSYEKEAYQRLSVFPLGVSMGVAIVNSKMPIKLVSDTLGKMVKIAKRKSKQDSEGKFGSEIYIYMQKFDQIPTEEELKSLENFTSFPMSGREFLEFVEEVKFFVEVGVSPNWVKRVFGEEKPSQVDACINLLFKMARASKESDERKALEKLYEIHGKFKIGDFKFKHLDISSVIRILAEKASKVEDSELRKTVSIILLGG